MADFDVIVVGAGCAGSIAAYELATAGKSVPVIERGTHAWAKNVTGGRIYTHVLGSIFPDFATEAPLERKITHEKISLMSPDAATTLDFTSPQLARPGADSYSVLRARFDQWLADQAENAGAEMITGIAVEDLLLENGKVLGVSAGGDEITAELVILADGVNSLLRTKAGLADTPRPDQVAVGVRETVALDPGVIEDRFLCEPGEGAAWLFAGDATHGTVGGGFLYTNTDTVSIGLVATLSDMVKQDTPIYQMMEDFKDHASITPILRGAELVEYSGHLIPEGGYDALPKLYGDGVLVTGDAAMLCINIGYQVRGMDFAMASGQIAARAAVKALDRGDTGPEALSSYETGLKNSFVLQDLEAFRKFPHFMEKTTRIFQEYPEMAEQIMLSMFVVDGNPVTPLRKKIMKPVKEVGLLNIAKDALGGVRAL
jgi:electron transfer flavoprotein-quinone oxidoreductase